MLLKGAGSPIIVVPGIASDIIFASNGLNLPLTVDSGVKYLKDYQENLQASPADYAPIEGSRLATTVAEGAQLGPELVTNGDFSAWTGDNPDGWAVIGEVGSDPVVTQVTEGSRFYSSSTINRPVIQQILLSVNKRYLFTVDINTVNSGIWRIGDSLVGGGCELTGSGEGIFSFEGIPNVNPVDVRGHGAAPIDIIVSSFSVREVIPTVYTVTADNKPLHPYELISTQQGTVKKYINYPLRQNTTAYVVGDKVSVSALTGDIHYPDSQTITVGTLETGTVADLQLTDGTMVQVSETTGTPGFDVEFAFSGLHQATPGRIVLNGYYNGNHSVASQVWNYTTESWDTLGTLPSAASVGEHIFSGLTSDNVSGGAGIFRLYHSDPGNINHSVFVDGLRIEEAADGTTELYLEATVGGTSNGTAPAFSAAQIGTSVADDSVTWTVKGYHTLEGPRIEGARTNLCLWSQDATHPIYQTFNATANSATEIELSDIAGLVYQTVPVAPETKYTVSQDIVFGTATGPLWAVYDLTNSAFIVVNIALTEGRNELAFTTPAGCISVAVYRVRRATSIGTLYSDNLQLETGDFATSRIPTTTATVTRPSDIVTAAWPAGLVNDFFAHGVFTPIADSQFDSTYKNVLSISPTATVQVKDTIIKFYKDHPSPVQVAQTFLPTTKGVPIEYMLYQSAVVGIGIRFREDGGSWSGWGVEGSADAKADVQIASNFYLGASNTQTAYANANYPWTLYGKLPSGLADAAAVQAWMEDNL